MTAVAVERDVDRVDERSAEEARAHAETDRPWTERLLLRYLRWDWQHPHSLYMRTQHRLAFIFFRLGLGRFDSDMVLTTTGRKSGLPRRVVLGAIYIDDRLYAMDPFGPRADWFRNLLADPIVTVQRRGRTWTARATRVTHHDEAATLYERIPGATGSAMRWLLRVEGIAETAEAFADNIDQFYFVRFHDVDELGPPPMTADLVWAWPAAGGVGLLGWVAKRRLGVARATALAALAGLVTIRRRAIVDWVMEVMTTKPSGPIGRYLYRDATSLHGEAWRLCHERLALRREDRLLDVGCGGGTFLAQALEKVERAAGLDHSPDMVAMTKENNAEAVTAGRLDVRLGDAAALPWEDGAFDVVTNLAAFTAMREPERVLSEAARVLKPGGRFVVATMAKPEREDLGARVMRWLMPDAKLYNDDELTQMLKAAGLRDVEADSSAGDFQLGYGTKA